MIVKWISRAHINLEFKSVQVPLFVSWKRFPVSYKATLLIKLTSFLYALYLSYAIRMKTRNPLILFDIILLRYFIFFSFHQTNKQLKLIKTESQSKIEISDRDLAAAHLLISQVSYLRLHCSKLSAASSLWTCFTVPYSHANLNIQSSLPLITIC